MKEGISEEYPLFCSVADSIYLDDILIIIFMKYNQK